ncbi:MAG: DNA phosphorothioation-associated protein 4 [Cyanomargarita calcarea GSE-NOS-MK-12-04C]|jgi:dnd system-associated protein 4|uniref:DNA phosphorothioation-associated protein 4 n=1 Tax=Cyanomargarita calcarea GSE-NOS-MK-12-04C TaxID=2839659 RepID=A0A951QSP7_9CYAN|nr:DNA phosphorothioation-associated protein 4 [Cyanomargarita calcarea GSE-NOS-MK-12-04C]
MAETGRIRVAKDKAELVKALTTIDGATGPFQTFADAIVFAAALGAKYKKRLPLGEISKKEPAPIRLEYFASMGNDLLIKLLAVNETEEIKILSFTEEEYAVKRNHIFEEYANGGLEILQNELRGSVDYSERILLFLSYERTKNEQQEEEFDLTKFLA